MKKIKIKRATTIGLVDFEGELIRRHGYRFCFGASKYIDPEGEYYYLIELSTGASIYKVWAYITLAKDAKKAALIRLEEGKHLLAPTIAMFQGKYPQFDYPINPSV